MAFDFKKEYKEFYLPKNRPEIVAVPKANYIAVRGKGDPNEEGGAYQKAVGILYAEFLTIDEGLRVQMMHIGSYDDEPASVKIMNDFIKEQGYKTDINEKRLHHEIYLSDPRKTAPEKLKTVIRHPIKKR
ncbi:MAG TPA: GyrI-like domain-containing protein [Spirochaetota bacterium]|nr:GyrI-like domain-containing protein [Spirochaetota bacterium]HOS32290.1 GyrI-like domain-containing protein [Spirochaetota bacterium]HOS54696.1 GyrI-like domain-containing protein [Spirochaetota bacterium]HQF77284.1 GyrI-like domain-containing protein [Spirochaetota bacterium]HQH29360.1 GyrI-like domain-containing protein [Spirochaetota bacterium]